MRIVKVKKGSLYTVVWEYSSLGETQLPLSVILEGYKEGEVITKKRLGASRAVADKPMRVRRSSKFSTDIVKEQLQCMSDDEFEGEAMSSDNSLSSDDDDAAKYDSNNDWEIVEKKNIHGCRMIKKKVPLAQEKMRQLMVFIGFLMVKSVTYLPE